MAPATDERSDLEPGDFERSGAERRLGMVVAGTYRIVRHVGSGGSSHVFEAEHVRLGSPVALKLLRPELDNGRKVAQRFRREARALARLRSEHVVGVLDCGELDDGTPYLVMELLQGEDLRSLIDREGSLPARRAVQIVREACRGLTVVHGAGLVHRDLKPENLFIARRSTGEDWCKVLDFGVAKMEASLSTAQGAIVGTVRYMAPEQLADGAAVGPATDVYALGAILYECLSGKPVHAGNTVQEVMFAVMNTEPESLSRAELGVSDKLASAVRHCLAKAPARRPGSTDELERLLAAAFFDNRESGLGATLADDSPLPPLTPARSAPTKNRGFAALALATLTGAAISWTIKPAQHIGVTAVTSTPVSTLPNAAEPPSHVEAAQHVFAAPDAVTARSEPEAAAPAMHSVQPTRRANPVPHAAASASARISHVSVGNLDQANPYAE